MAITIPMLNREHLRPGDRVCAAVSGGADSVALLLLLHAANALPRNGLGVGLSAVHVHHGLRGEEADADLDFVEALCMRLGIPLHVARVSVPERMAVARAAGEAETLEEAARNLRYEVFRGLIAEEHADSVLTAHTLDDQAETVLMKLLRGAWTEGLSGIHPVVLVAQTHVAQTHVTQTRVAQTPVSGARRVAPGKGSDREGKIVRPLLGARRAELEDFLRGRGQVWRTDSSNADDAFTRNRVRHTLVPMLRQYNPSIDQTLGNLAELAREEEARWQVELDRVLGGVLLPGKPVRGGGRTVSTGAGEAGTVAIEIERLREFDPALRRRVVRAAARTLGVRLSFGDTARLLALAGFGQDGAAAARPGAKLSLAGGFGGERTARELRLERREQTAPQDQGMGGHLAKDVRGG